MHFYLLAMSVPLFFIFTENNSNKKIYNYFFILIFIFLFLIVSFRAVGSDYQIYLRYYYSFYKLDEFKLSLSGDLAYDYLNYIFTRFNFPFYYLTTMVSATFFISLYFFLRTTANPWLGLFISMPFYIFNFSMSAMRQSMAFSFFLMAIVIIQKNKIFKSYLYMIVGILFHKSLVFFFILQSVYKKISINHILLFFLTLIGVFTYRHQEISRMFFNYIIKSEGLNSTGVYLRIIPIIFSTVLFFLMKNHYKQKLIEEKNIIEVLIFFTIIFFFLIPINSTAADRLLIFSGVIQMIVITRFSILFEKNKTVYSLIIISNIIFYYSFYIIWALNGNVFSSFKNYSFLFVI